MISFEISPSSSSSSSSTPKLTDHIFEPDESWGLLILSWRLFSINFKNVPHFSFALAHFISLFNTYEQRASNCREHDKSVSEQHWRHCAVHGGYKDVPTTGEGLQNSEQIIEHLSRIKNLNTRENKLMTIIVFAKAYDMPAAVVDAYSKEAEKLSGQLQAFLSKNEKSERQRNNWMTKEELQTFTATLKADIPPKIKSFEDYERVMRYVLVQFHLSHPIRK
jgi:hypothetical protein